MFIGRSANAARPALLKTGSVCDPAGRPGALESIIRGRAECEGTLERCATPDVSKADKSQGYKTITCTGLTRKSANSTLRPGGPY